MTKYYSQTKNPSQNREDTHEVDAQIDENVYNIIEETEAAEGDNIENYNVLSRDMVVRSDETDSGFGVQPLQPIDTGASKDYNSYMERQKE